MCLGTLTRRMQGEQGSNNQELTLSFEKIVWNRKMRQVYFVELRRMSLKRLRSNKSRQTTMSTRHLMTSKKAATIKTVRTMVSSSRLEQDNDAHNDALSRRQSLSPSSKRKC